MADRTASQYRQRISQWDELIGELRRHDTRFSRARGTVFLVVLVFAFLGWQIPDWRMALLVAAGAAFVAFVAVIWCHEQLLERLSNARTRRALQRHQLGRFQRDWERPPEYRVDLPVQSAALAHDLDLTGYGSVYQWLCRAHTPRGRTLLSDWLINSAEPPEIVARQDAVRFLATQRDLRDDLEFHGWKLAASDTGPEAFVRWAEQPPRYAGRPRLRMLVRALTLAMIVLPVALFFQWLPLGWWLVVLGLVAVNVLVNAVFVGSIHDLFNQITAGKNELVHYSALFECVANLPPKSERLRDLAQQMNAGGDDFRVALGRLQRIMQLANGRRSSVFGIPYVFVQILWLWDFHMVGWLERWQVECGASVSDWFDAVAQLECLGSLAAMAADQPDWVYPMVRTGADVMTAEALGHPLLKPAECRRNDVQLGPPGSFLLVTGSNMSGKSTLLRAIGVNAVLAQAGAPVCATRLEMPAAELATSMRVTDSLSDGVSFFFAELTRLKAVVDHSRAVDKGRGKRLLFLLDEILQGTNSAERHIAVSKVVAQLLRAPAIGAVSTHDLELAADPLLMDHCQNVHFREQFIEVDGRREMSFDYQLREGVSPTTNALKLLEMVGLSD